MSIPLVTCFLCESDGFELGENHYFSQAIIQARLRNQDATIYIITNGKFKYDFDNNINIIHPNTISNYDAEYLNNIHFRKKSHYLISAMRRIFLLCDLMEYCQLDRCFQFESDVFLYLNVDKVLNNYNDYLMANCIDYLSNAGVWYVNNRDIIKSLCQFINFFHRADNKEDEIYKNLSQNASQHYEYLLLDDIYKGDAADMHYLSLFYIYNKNLIGDLSAINKNGFFDLSVHRIEILPTYYAESVEKMFPEQIIKNRYKCKKIYAKNNNIYCKINHKSQFLGRKYNNEKFVRVFSIHAGSNEKWLCKYYAIDAWPDEMKLSITSKAMVDLMPERRYFESRLFLIPEFKNIKRARELADYVLKNRKDTKIYSNYASWLNRQRADSE